MKVKTRSRGRVSNLPSDILDLRDSEYVGKDFSDRQIDKLTVVNCRFVDCSFENTVFRQASFGAGGKESTYVNCSFAGAKITATAPGNTYFESCDFSNVKIEEFLGLEAQFIDCTFSGVLKKCVFQRRIPDADQQLAGRELNEFRGNDFSAAKFHDVDFRAGIDLNEQKLPIDPRYVLIPDGESFLREIREVYLGEKDLKLREKVFTVLRILQYGVDEGQTQLFVTSRTFPKSLRPTAEMLLSRGKGVSRAMGIE
jgi:hypothetical protein